MRRHRPEDEVQVARWNAFLVGLHHLGERLVFGLVAALVVDVGRLHLPVVNLVVCGLLAQVQRVGSAQVNW